MRYQTIMTCLAGMLAAGCAQNKPEATTQPSPPSSQTTDIMIVDSINDSGIRTAIIAQHTLYAYHFLEGGAELNDLGKRDLAVLMTHFKARGGGTLSIRRGDTPDTLYVERVSGVKDLLKSGGIDLATVQIADASPGGLGMTGNNAVRAMSKSLPETPYESSGTSGGGGSPGGVSGASTGASSPSTPGTGAGQ